MADDLAGLGSGRVSAHEPQQQLLGRVVPHAADSDREFQASRRYWQNLEKIPLPATAFREGATRVALLRVTIGACGALDPFRRW
jgi:hypothetical protein